MTSSCVLSSSSCTITRHGIATTLDASKKKEMQTARRIFLLLMLTTSVHASSPDLWLHNAVFAVLGAPLLRRVRSRVGSPAHSCARPARCECEHDTNLDPLPPPFCALLLPYCSATVRRVKRYDARARVCGGAKLVSGVGWLGSTSDRYCHLYAAAGCGTIDD